MQEYDFEVAIVGGGSAGYAAARTAHDAGLKTVVIEGGEEVGGLCILRGCMPTKALLYAAEVLHLASHPQIWGIRTENAGFDYAKVLARKNAMIEDFAGYRRSQLESGRFEFIRANARFTDPQHLFLSNGRTISARYFVLTTGSSITPSPLPFLNELGFITSDEALIMPKLPESIIVLGGGLVAVEFAQFFTRFGVKVTMIQRGSQLLKGFDADASEAIEKVLVREGVSLFKDSKLLGGRCEQGRKELTFQHGDQQSTVAAEQIFYALGRSPNTRGLDLANAGVATDGLRIITNDEMRTSASHIYAAGDCTGPHEIVHIAIQQGEISAHNIAHPERHRKMDYRLLISVVFTEPQMAYVGLTEKEAKAANRPYIVASYPFADHGKSMIAEAKDGFVKLLADPVTGEILGGACVGPEGGELIHEIVAAMYKRMTVGELAVMPHYHPTLAEIWTYPAEELASQIKPTAG